MKKLYKIWIFTISFLLVSSVGLTQSLTLSWEGEPLGDTILAIGDMGGFEIVAHAVVTNNTSEAMNIKVRRVQLQMIEGTMSQFCWGLCYPPNVDESANPMLIGAGESSGDEDFSGHYLPQGQFGDSYVEYEFFNMDNENEFVKVVVQYAATVVGTNEIAESSIRAFPNPVVNTLNVAAKGMTQIEMINFTGQTVYKENFNSRPADQVTTIDCSSFVPGFYFLRVEHEGGTTTSRMLVN